MHGLQPEGKHLACRRRQPDQQTISETAVLRMFMLTAIMGKDGCRYDVHVGAITECCQRENSASVITHVAVSIGYLPFFTVTLLHGIRFLVRSVRVVILSTQCQSPETQNETPTRTTIPHMPHVCPH